MYILIKIGEKIIQTLKKCFKIKSVSHNIKLLKQCLGKKIKNKSSHS